MYAGPGHQATTGLGAAAAAAAVASAAPPSAGIHAGRGLTHLCWCLIKFCLERKT